MKSAVTLEIGQRLQEHLCKQDIRKMAEEIGTSSVTLRKWLHGEVPYSFILLARLCKVYKLDLNEILIGEHNGSNSNRSEY